MDSNLMIFIFTIKTLTIFFVFVEVTFISFFIFSWMKEAMKFCVSAYGHNFKIFNSIIELIKIYMMNTFRWFKFSADVFFHNASMLITSFMRRNPNRIIAVEFEKSPAFPSVGFISSLYLFPYFCFVRIASETVTTLLMFWRWVSFFKFSFNTVSRMKTFIPRGSLFNSHIEMIS